MGWVELEETQTPPTPLPHPPAERRRGRGHFPHRQSDLSPRVVSPRELDLLPRARVNGLRNQPAFLVSRRGLPESFLPLDSDLLGEARQAPAMQGFLPVNSVTPHRPIDDKVTHQSAFFFLK